MILSILIYSAFVIALALSLSNYPIFALFALIANLFIVMYIGRQIVRCVLFPYGNKMVTRVLDNQMNERFGNEFAKILDRTYLQIKDYMIEPMPGAPQNEESDGRAFQVNNGKFLQFLSLKIGLMSACEILSLYSDINTRCINHSKSINKPKNRYFVELTRIMVDVKDILKKLRVQFKPASGMNYDPLEKNISFWSLYSQEEVLEINAITALYEAKGIPKIV